MREAKCFKLKLMLGYSKASLRSRRKMAEARRESGAGRRGPGDWKRGVFASPTAAPFTPATQATLTSRNEQKTHIMRDTMTMD